MENKLGNKIEILGLSETANSELRKNGIDTVQDLMLLINLKLVASSENEPKISMKDAILEVFKEHPYKLFFCNDIRDAIREKYGLKASYDLESIKSLCSAMARKGILERTGTATYRYRGDNKTSNPYNIAPPITLKEAILETLETMHGEFSFKDIREKIRKRYKGRIAAKMESIKPYLSSFTKEGILERTSSGNYIKTEDLCYIRPTCGPIWPDLDSFLQAHIGKEIEIRYKSSRPKSENRWRKEKVLRYDDHYLYVERQFPSGHHVCYQKQRIVEYRRFVEFERNN
ncbi:hypothetical protein IK110_04210 [Candidatus Saccharibacteria bacterium]|nr:hypothetical protein [Candidatus Saccharibacteria bacterium]